MSHMVSCRTSVYGSADEAFRLLPDAGINCAELCGVAPDELAGARDRAAKHGVVIGTVDAGVDLADEASLAAYRTLLRTTGAAGIANLFTSLKAPEGFDRTACMSALRELCAEAEALDVTICMETHPPFARNAADAAATMDTVRSASLRMNFDTANIYYYNENVDGLAELEQIVDRVKTVHIKDTDGGFRSANFPVPGQGIVNFPETFRIFDSASVPGPFALELEGPLTSGKALEERHEAVQAATAYLRGIGVM